MARSRKSPAGKGAAADPLYLAFGKQVARRRAQGDRPLTQQALAAQVGLSRESIANIECGRQQVLLHHALDIARVLRVDLRELLPEAVEASPVSELVKEHPSAHRQFVETALSQAKPAIQSRSA